MSDPVLRDRVAARRGGEEDLGRFGLVLFHALAVEQHDRIFDLAGDDAVVGGALEPVRRLGDVLRRPFAVAQHDAIRIGRVVVACVRGAQEILRRLVVIRRLAIQALERHHAEIIHRSGMILGRGALELRLGPGRVFRHAIRALNQHRSEFVGRLGIAEIAGEAVPARSLLIAAGDRGTFAIDLADQRHRRRILGIGVKTAFGLQEGVKEIAALIGAEGHIGRHAVRSRRQRGRRCGGSSEG